ncbi:MAG: hypothetical protein HOF77_02505 [Actinobacteria bacterium]|jgi:multisubunit Na+/H+ antiporter MnhE subunit|nr:hypothetical protein [Actinomycetota bacterium]
MKYKSKAWIGLLVIATLGWPILAPDYRPGQVILATGFGYIAVRFFGKVLASGSGKDIYSHLEEKEEDEES